MDELNRNDLDALMTHERPNSVSLIMPIHLGGPETRRNPIVLRTLLDKAEESLRNARMSGPQAREHLNDARELLTDSGIWRRGARGTAIFITEGKTRVFGLRIPLPKRVYVGRRFHTRHLLRMFAVDGRFYLLALSRDSVKLYEATRWMIRELDLPPDTPHSFEDLARYIDTERQLQWHTRTQPIGQSRVRAAMFHGSGVGTDDRWEKRQTLDYCHMVAEGVERVLENVPVQAPLILAAAEPTASIYRDASHHRLLHEEVVHGNPDGLSADELRIAAWPLVEPIVQAAADREVGRFEEARGAGHASTDLQEVLTAAHNGQIRTLFIAGNDAGDDACWGRFDADAREMETHPEPWPGDDDLIDLAASRAFLTGAGIIPLPRDKMPGGADVAATFRYVPVV